MTRTVYRCPLCDGINVYETVRRCMNAPHDILGDMPTDEECWCADCESTIPFVNATEKDGL